MLNGKYIHMNFVHEEDAEFILALRLNQQLSHYISKTNNDLESQKQWLKKYKERENSKQEYYFIISRKNSELHSEERVGTVRVYDFKESSFCWGSWLIKPGNSPKVAIESFLMIYDFGFSLGFEKSHFDVRFNNTSVRRFHERMGAKQTHSDDLNVFYEITKEIYESKKFNIANWL